MASTKYARSQVYKNASDFFNVANKAAKKCGATYDFTCPVCGGRAHVERELINGCLRAWCEDCDNRVIE